jgi:hypothetical protein
VAVAGAAQAVEPVVAAAGEEAGAAVALEEAAVAAETKGAP